MFQMLERFT